MSWAFHMVFKKMDCYKTKIECKICPVCKDFSKYPEAEWRFIFTHHHDHINYTECLLCPDILKDLSANKLGKPYLIFVHAPTKRKTSGIYIFWDLWTVRWWETAVYCPKDVQRRLAKRPLLTWKLITKYRLIS